MMIKNTCIYTFFIPQLNVVIQHAARGPRWGRVSRHRFAPQSSRRRSVDQVTGGCVCPAGPQQKRSRYRHQRLEAALSAGAGSIHRPSKSPRPATDPAAVNGAQRVKDTARRERRNCSGQSMAPPTLTPGAAEERTRTYHT